MKFPVLPTVVTLLLAAYAADAQTPAAPRAPHVAFIEGRPFADVIKKAKAEKKPILLDIVASWCQPCKMMDRTTFADPEVVAWTGKATISARVDAEKGEGKKLAFRYAIRSFPTVLFLNSDGTEIDRLLGAFGPVEFKNYGSDILAGKSKLVEGLAKLGKTWSAESAAQWINTLSQRNDLARLRPIALRVLHEDPELVRSETLDALGSLVALEDYSESLSAETTDLLTTYVPRLQSEPRGVVFAMVLARELARRGDVVEVRKLVEPTVKRAGETSGIASDLLTALGHAEKRAGKLEAATAAYRRAMASADAVGAAPYSRAIKQLDLAEALALAGKPAEAKAALATALERAGREAGVLTRAARVWLQLKSPQQALELAKKAVSLSNGEDAAAQGVLASSLVATGDEGGGLAAWKRASEIEPENLEYQKPLFAEKKKKPAAKPS